MIRTAVSAWNGVRCVVKEDKTGDEYSEMLWVRGEVGPKSKIGSFIDQLTDDTDRWIGKRIRILRWKDGDRLIELVPEAKSEEKPTKKGK